MSEIQEFREGDQIVIPGIGAFTRCGDQFWRSATQAMVGSDVFARALLAEPIRYIPAPKPAPTPLTLMQAIEAAREGKTVLLRHETYRWRDGTLICEQDGVPAVLTDLTVEGPWFIVEDGQ